MSRPRAMLPDPASNKIGAESEGDARGTVPPRRSDQPLPQADDPSAPSNLGVAKAQLEAALAHHGARRVRAGDRLHSGGAA
jgi:hypothetical protein